MTRFRWLALEWVVVVSREDSFRVAPVAVVSRDLELLGRVVVRETDAFHGPSNDGTLWVSLSSR